MTEPVAFDWQPMGWCFIQRSGCDPFSIDQTASVDFAGDRSQPRMAAETTHRAMLERHGGSAGAPWWFSRRAAE